MQRLALASTALALLAGATLSAPAQAGSYQHHSAGNVTHSERVAIANSRYRLNGLRSRVRSDGHVSLWERARLRAATARHRALAYRLRHN